MEDDLFEELLDDLRAFVDFFAPLLRDELDFFAPDLLDRDFEPLFDALFRLVDFAIADVLSFPSKRARESHIPPS